MKIINIYRFIIAVLVFVIIMFFHDYLSITLLVYITIILAGVGFLNCFVGGGETMKGINIWRFVIVTMMAIPTIVLFFNKDLGITLFVCPALVLAVFELLCMMVD